MIVIIIILTASSPFLAAGHAPDCTTLAHPFQLIVLEIVREFGACTFVATNEN